MSLNKKAVWTRVVFVLLMTAMLGLSLMPRAFAGDHHDIKKVQETLRTKGYYEGKVDGVFGLRTRASIRAYQKAENLPITGQADTRTAAGLGVRPESNWGNSESARWELGQGSDIVIGDVKRDKPSAGIRRARASKTSRKEVSRATAMENNREGGANQQQAENEEPDQ